MISLFFYEDSLAFLVVVFSHVHEFAVGVDLLEMVFAGLLDVIVNSVFLLTFEVPVHEAHQDEKDIWFPVDEDVLDIDVDDGFAGLLVLLPSFQLQELYALGLYQGLVGWICELEYPISNFHALHRKLFL